MSKTNPQLWWLVYKAKWEHWQSSFDWFLYTLFGIGLPLFIGGLILFVLYRMGVEVDANTLLSHGELCIYAASLIAASLYSLDRGDISARYVRLLTYAWLVIVASLYSVITLRDRILDASGKAIDETSLTIVSLFVFSVSVALSYFTKVGERNMSAIQRSAELEDARREKRHSEDALERDFDASS